MYSSNGSRVIILNITIKENANDGTAICQVDYSENFTLVNQDQIQSAHWSNQQVSIFTAYA